LSSFDPLAQGARNHYREDEYFSLNVKNGVVRGPTGARVITLPEELIAGLHIGLEEEAGAAAGTVLYECGKWWGKQFVRHHGLEVRHFYNCDTGDMPYYFFEQVLGNVWSLHGWGTVDFSFELKDRGFIIVNVQNAMYSEVVGNIGRTSDHIVAGLLSAIGTDLAGCELECVEIACRSKGDARCSFLLGMGSRLTAVEDMVRGKRSRVEIVAELDKGAL
jgi:predicted hydrocarbon binding protein